jgi:hypothetical protein
MSVTIDFSPELEAYLTARAQEQGMSVGEYVQRLIGVPPAAKTTRPLTPAERADLWLRSSGGLPNTPVLSDEAISRESIYAERG